MDTGLRRHDGSCIIHTTPGSKCRAGPTYPTHSADSEIYFLDLVAQFLHVPIQCALTDAEHLGGGLAMTVVLAQCL
jgi:hypothetical protein